MVQREGRLLRGWLGAAVATSLAALSHLAGGGHVPAPAVWLLAFAFAGLVCVGLAGKSLSWARLLVAVCTSQAIYHLLFQLGHAAPAGFTPALGHAGHHDALLPAGALLPEVSGQAATATDPAMLAAHLAAAAATVLLLRRGEHAAAALVGTVALAAPRRLSSWRPIPRVRLAAPVELLIQPFAALGVPLLALRHRGPPLNHAF
ncbi:hypothetical protein ACMX2H_05200 [Arthrobacter sulfonylureivorans]|uniref:hypothetical protein n=1 Tax=Arthrobacter sulfonylureivorans TaxID=2486855 RepID=UPI0039E264BF